MTREDAKKLMPVIQAWIEGKEIQYRNHYGEWIDIKENEGLRFVNSSSDYRIKPEPECRPFKNQEECWQEMLKHQPFGSLKLKDDGYFCLIGSVNKDDTITLVIEPNTYYAYHYIFEHYIFSDGTPFGIKVE